MKQIVLPSRVSVPQLVALLASASEVACDEPIEVDFTRLERVTPVFLTTLAATVSRWKRDGREVWFRGLEKCPITPYLQRMDFLKHCDVDLPESFNRHDSRGRFVPVRRVELPVERLAEEIAECFAPGGGDCEDPNAGFYGFLVYAVTEMGNNIRQHSSGVGYASVQFLKVEGLVILALADNGCGILRSFQRVEMPWSVEMTDADAIMKALEPRVSCKMGAPNEGVGLTILADLVRRMKGSLLIASGQGTVTMTRGQHPNTNRLPDGVRYEGTLVALAVRRAVAADFDEHLQGAKLEKRLLPAAKARAIFHP